MADVYSTSINPYYDVKANVNYAKKYQYGNSRVLVVIPEISEEERQKRLQATLDVMSAIASRKSGRQVRYFANK